MDFNENRCEVKIGQWGHPLNLGIDLDKGVDAKIFVNFNNVT